MASKEDVVRYLQAVHVDGYRWLSARKHPRLTFESGPVLTFAPDGQEGVSREIDILSRTSSHTGLYRIFAAINPKPESILDFANQYGLLGPGDDVGAMDEYAASDVEGLKERKLVYAERLSLWQRAIQAMKFGVELLDVLRSRDQKLAGRLVKWVSEGKDGPGFPYIESATFTDLVGNEGSLEPWREMGLLKKSDPLFSVSWFLAQIATRQMEKHVNLVMSYDEDRWALRNIPRNLLGAMWLQLAQAMIGNGELRECKECGRWFEVSLQANRKSKVYCSDACKSKAYRERADRARKMFAAGESAKTIAKELATTAEQVKKWVTSS